MKREVYLAIPSWETLYRAGEKRGAFTITVLEWDMCGKYPFHTEGGEILFSVPVRGERKRLRDTLRGVYGFEARTVVRN
jgi:hypothetical protein